MSENNMQSGRMASFKQAGNYQQDGAQYSILKKSPRKSDRNEIDDLSNSSFPYKPPSVIAEESKVQPSGAKNHRPKYSLQSQLNKDIVPIILV